jgi:hypothetical protein
MTDPAENNTVWHLIISPFLHLPDRYVRIQSNTYWNKNMPTGTGRKNYNSTSCIYGIFFDPKGVHQK